MAEFGRHEANGSEDAMRTEATSGRSSHTDTNTHTPLDHQSPSLEVSAAAFFRLRAFSPSNCVCHSDAVS